MRLDSGVADDERAAAWHRLRDGSARLATGTRSALLAPLPSPAVLGPGSPNRSTADRSAARSIVMVGGTMTSPLAISGPWKWL